MGLFYGAPGGDRTHNLQRRRLTRYPIAPRVHRISSCNKRRGYFAQRSAAAFSGFVLRSCDAFGVGRPHNLQRRRLTRYPIAPRVHRISSCNKRRGYFAQRSAAAFSGFVLRSCDAFGVGRPHNLQRRRLTRYPIAPRVHIQFLCPPGLLRGFAARATASGGANPDRRRRSAIRSRHECISGVLYHNFGKNALYFAADMV